MLQVLELSDLAIVDSLRLELGAGFNVLSGETGAGKSILVDALALLTGGRADSSLVRQGAKWALVQGYFAVAESVRQRAEAGAREDALELDLHDISDIHDQDAHDQNTHDIDIHDIEVLARRLQPGKGSTARLNGEVVTVGELARVGEMLVAIFGQHASQTLLDSRAQRQLLDRTLDPAGRDVLEHYQQVFARYQQIDKALTALQGDVRERARRLDILRYQVDEIDAAAIKPNEETTLEQRVKQLRHGERIRQQTARAAALLAEADINANDLVAEAVESLRSVAKYHPDVAALSQELADTLTSLQATTETLSELAADVELEPGELARLDARLTLLETLKSKYGDTLAAVLAYRQEAAAELERLEHADADLSRLQREHDQLTARLRDLAARLSAARTQSAQHLSERVSDELQPLGMPHAQFVVAVTPQDRLLTHGSDDVRFTFSANLGEPLAPLAQVASGGELSRIMLALNVVTGTDSPTLIFDEVDAGIGGQTARVVGRLLATLARDHQVLVVTHLAQVAAFADRHFVVEKQQQAGRTTTHVRQLDGDERERELARMLSGSVSDTARAHARELLAERNTLLPTPS